MKIKSNITSVLLVSLSFLFAGVATAKSVTVSQKDKKFLIDGKPVEKLKVKAGDTVVFANDDKAAHNVFSTSEGMKFNLKIQNPGQKDEHKFEAKGSSGTIRCAIHPKMKLEVEVE